MDVMVYLPDNTGIHLRIEDCKSAVTSKFFQAMIDALNLPVHLSSKCFALWLKSPLLDVQLKPQHVPFRMVKQWGTLIEQFSMAGSLVKAKDEPALVFKRNAFLTKEEEMKIDNCLVLDILLMEARSNIQHGIYPCDPEDVEQLGILFCLMNKDNLPSNEEENESVKHTIQAVVPDHMSRARKSLMKRQKSVEERVLHTYKASAAKEGVENAQLEFMKICWQLPYYGSVVFEGKVTKTHSRSLAFLLLHGSAMQVHVAINTSGLWLIDHEKKHVLVGLLHGQFNWEVATTSKNQEGVDEEAIPSLFIEFDEQNCSKLLEIISKQASMMKSMIETCTSLMIQSRQKNASVETEGDSHQSEHSSRSSRLMSKRVRPLLDRNNSVTCNRLAKLCLTPIDEQDFPKSGKEGNLVKAQVNPNVLTSPSSCSQSLESDERSKKSHSCKHQTSFFRHKQKSKKSDGSFEERDELL